MEATELLLHIAAGRYDDVLDRIIDGAVARRRLVSDAQAAETLATLELNDEIEFTDKVSPKYLRGKRAQIVGFEGETIKVRMLDSARHGQKYIGFGQRFSTQASIVKPTGRNHNHFPGE